MTPDQISQLLLTMRDVGIAIVLSLIVGLCVIALILLIRSRSKIDASNSKQFEQFTLMLAKAQNQQDTETAQKLVPLLEVVALVKISLDQNTQAFIESRDYRAESLTTLKEVATLQATNNQLMAALRIDVKAWPQEALTSIGNLEENLETSLTKLKREIVQSILEMPPDSSLAKYFQDILTKLDQILINVTGNAALIKALSPTTQQPRAPIHTPAPSAEALALKRGTGEITAVRIEPDAYKPAKPEDTDLKPTG